MHSSPSLPWPATFARRHVAIALIAVFLASTLAGAQPAPVEAAPVLRSGFTDTVVWSGLALPTVVQFAANGHVFVAEKSGIIKRFTSLTDTTADVSADLRNQVYNYWDKGLLGMAVHPQYPAQPYLYALYAYLDRSDPIQAMWHRDSGNDSCPSAPDGPGSTTDGCMTRSRLSRITLNSSGVMTSQTTFITDWCGQFPSHSIGALGFGADGYLYATGGEGASFNPNNLDYGQFGGTVINPATGQPYVPRNPCGDPPAGVGGNMTLPTTEGGALRSQDRRTTGDSLGLSGTVIRINPSNGNPAPTNPAYGSGSTNNQRILGYGLRNPFRFAFRPGTNDLYIGDVGSNYWEEFNRYPASASDVRNYGWPCYENTARHPGWDALNANLCESLYSQGSSAFRAPYYAYPWNKALPNSNGSCSLSGGGTIAGVAFYPGGNYPSAYDGALFWADYTRRCIWAMQVGSNGLPDPAKIYRMVDDAGTGPVDLKSGPGGDMFWVDMTDGKVHRISYSAANQPPTVVATATPTSGPAPLTVNYDASGSSDPNAGDTLSFAWDLDGDGQYDDATGATASRSYAAGSYTTGVRVTDNHGASSTKSFVISAGNEPPLPVISTPVAGFSWSVNQNISFSGSATDPEDGTLAASRLTWRVVLHHCATPSSCHEHLIDTITGVASGSFSAPDHDYPAYLELRLTARDSAGLEATVTRQFEPKTVDLTFASDPTGLSLVAGGQTRSAPFTRTFIVGSAIAISAPTPQSLGGTSYAYSSWSDGGSRSHTITAPTGNATYTARYTATGAADMPNSCSNATTNSSQGTWLMETLSSGTDVDWYRFNLGQKGWVRIVLGSLPRNYRLDLYSSCGTRIASSNAGGRQFEEIYRKLSAGSYRVRVKSSAGAFDAAAQYGLRFERLAGGLHALSSNAWTGGGTLQIHGEVLNNRGYNQRQVTVQATFYNAADGVIGSASAATYLDIIKARKRSPFNISVPTPANYSHYTLAVSGQQTSQAPIGRLKLLSQTSAVDGSELVLSGSIRNNNTFRVNSALTAATLYDKWGSVLNTKTGSTSPSSISAGASASYSVRFSNYDGWNLARILRQAYR